MLKRSYLIGGDGFGLREGRARVRCHGWDEPEGRCILYTPHCDGFYEEVRVRAVLGGSSEGN